MKGCTGSANLTPAAIQLVPNGGIEFLDGARPACSFMKKRG
jgi:hypothetical protein